ncbi:MAG: hypothetical protein II844_02650 [Prevotella sp.]|nr:hypothetical protein [Prevotella sp.]
MRKRQLTYGAMAALALAFGLTSCQNELAELTPSGGERITLSVTQDDAAGTRTYLNDDKKVVWSDGDALSLFDTKNINQPFELTKGAGSTTGEFGGTVSVDSRKEYCAVYPYDADYTFSSGTVTGVTLPAEQTAVANGFDKSAAIMTGYTTDAKNLAFKQLCAFVQITTESATKKIVFKTNGTESLAGTLDVAIDEDGIGTATVTSGGTGTVTLVPAGNEESIAAGTYLIAVLPGTLTQGFTMECVGTDGDGLTRSYNGSTSVLNRKAVINMGTASTSEGWNFVHECTHTYAKGAYAPTANNGTGEEGTDWVDLGIRINGKKILFATRNLGAEREYDYGDYYAWGATEPWCIGYDQDGIDVTASNATAYVTKHWKDGKSDGYIETNAPFYSSGTGSDAIYTKYTAGGDVLAAEDDAASVQWGADWRMPTYEEMLALVENTTYVETDDYKGTGISGHIFTGKGDFGNASLFIPAAGRFDGAAFLRSHGYYWSSTLKDMGRGNSLCIFEFNHVSGGIASRYYGYSVRAVRAVSE